MAYIGPGQGQMFGKPRGGPTGLAAFLSQPGLRDALMSTGAAMLAQSGQPGTFGSALGNALPMGMQAFQQGRQQDQLSQIIETMPPEQQKLLRALSGPQKVQALMSMMAPQQQPELEFQKGADGRIYGLNPTTGEQVSVVGPEEAPQEDPTRFATAKGRKFDLHDPEQRAAYEQAIAPAPTTGQSDVNWQTVERNGQTFQVHPRTGAVREVALPEVAGGPGEGTMSERQNSRLAEAATTANQMLNEVDDTLNDMRSAATRIPFVGGAARMFTNDEQQAAEVAALNFINPTVRYFSGAQMNEQEAGRYMQSFIPRFGDNPETVRMKRAMRQAAIRAMNSGQMRGESADGTPDYANLESFIVEFLAKYQALPDDPDEAARMRPGGMNR